MGTPYWDYRCATEACRCLIAFAKEYCSLTTLQVMHLVGNERSKSVITKLGIGYLGAGGSPHNSPNPQVCVRR
ncbi:GNAT family N-acetyltransferase [Vibrio zhugei]|uniref:GNAT family N-acetyltransferase n=1 Tax=Vibrio zhugei TaxID=2479546 RepID=A0ABV7CCZ0_9VIBR|nr:GNAT family N-acetyltransferase [Vibrio zhugei]